MDQFLHLAAQIAVIAAGFGQEHGPLGRGLLECRVIDPFDLLPAIRIHLSFIVHGPGRVGQGERSSSGVGERPLGARGAKKV